MKEQTLIFSYYNNLRGFLCLKKLFNIITCNYFGVVSGTTFLYAQTLQTKGFGMCMQDENCPINTWYFIVRVV
jgi:hypothetical protein